MRACFFSDVHANYEALVACLDHATDCDAMVCAGDLVGYGDKPNEVCDLIRQRGIRCVIGNHDAFALDRLAYAADKDSLYRAAWTRAALSDENRDWLAGLPDQLDIELDGRPVTVRHASPWDLTTYLYPDSPRLVDAVPTDGATLVVGHTHHAFVCPGTHGLLVGCGSVGQPRSGPAGAQYAVMQTETGAWSLRTAPYDIAALAARLSKNGWDNWAIRKLLNPAATR
ncbi:MAG: metallophosphoesterase family protein [bacterium]